MTFLWRTLKDEPGRGTEEKSLIVCHYSSVLAMEESTATSAVFFV